MTAIHALAARQLADEHARGALSPLQSTCALLERIHTHAPRLNAMYPVDHDGALAQAKGSEARLLKDVPRPAVYSAALASAAAE